MTGRAANGVNSGALTNHEVGSLERGQAHVDRKEANAAANGRIGAAEQRNVQRSENRQNARVYRKKHNAREKWFAAAVGRGGAPSHRREGPGPQTTPQRAGPGLKNLQVAGDICDPFPVMPFTFAHPAAILPLRRSRFLQTVPLIIGSLVPDVPYFLPTRFGRALFPDTHSLYGSIFICLPMGMALLILTVLLREPLTVLLGARVRWICLRSIERFTARPLHWPIALLSILIGSWTHIAWDSFTHQTGWTATRVAALSAPISVFGWDTATSHLLQYVSSVFGLAVMAIWLRSLVMRVPAGVMENQPRPRASWLVLAVIAFVSLSIGVSRAYLAWNASSYYHLGYLLLTRTIGWFAVLYLAAGVVTLLSRRLEPEPAR